MPELQPGDLLGGCRVDAVIGRGGMGVVYRAVQVQLGRLVALKVIAADRSGDAEFRERFERESRMAASIDHPNVVPVFHAGEERGALYLVMRYVAGSDLHALLRREGALAPARAAAIIAQVGGALDAAHAAGLVHRDVKPANVLLADEDHAYLGDFGLMRTIGPHQPITDSGQWIGTVDYASPEHLSGERTDARSDVYSLGCLLYAALTGGPPFPRGSVPATMLAHLNDAPPRPSASGAPPEFDRVVTRALAKAPADRYLSAGDLARAASAAARGEPVTESERTVATGPAAARSARAPTARTRVATPVHEPAEPPPAGRPRRLEPVPPAQAAPAPASRRAGAQPDPVQSPPRPARRRAAAPPEQVQSPPRPARRRAAAPPEQVASASPPPARRPRRRIALAAAIGLPLAGIATAAVVMYGLDDRGRAEASVPAPLTAAEVRATAEAFANAYETEDGRALRALLTSDVQRALSSGETLRGRAAVAGEYEHQFENEMTKAYELGELVISGGDTGRASGTYRVRRADESVGGDIVLGIVRASDRPRIALIAVTPKD